jgi:Replication factor-A C terminal domain
MQRRYVLNAAMIDFSGERLVNMFNEQAAALLGKSADDLHALKVHQRHLQLSTCNSRQLLGCSQPLLCLD